jgi:hypothetical protein
MRSPTGRHDGWLLRTRELVLTMVGTIVATGVFGDKWGEGRREDKLLWTLLATVQTWKIHFGDCANAHSSLQRQHPPMTTHMHRYLAHRSCDHAIAILPSPSQSQSCNQPSHTSGVITPVATLRLPIARSLVVSIYSDHRSIPMPILVLALTQLINGHGISPDPPFA